MKYAFKLKRISVALCTVLLLPGIAAAQSPTDWYNAGQKAVQDAKRLYPNVRRAKNVILFIGDGMGVSTVTAARILEGQLSGKSGEENALAFEKLPHLALSKTYSVNQQTSDSAPTMTAMVTGVKSNDGYLSVDHLTPDNEVNAGVIEAHKLTTILEQAERRGMSTGVIATARVTHATPAACYAHTAVRDWESNGNLPAGATVKDIAAQLLDNNIGNGLEVVLGGGRTQFYNNQTPDPEYPTRNGGRTDGRNLHVEWTGKYPNAAYVWNKAQFDAINPATTNHLLGLFERSHMQWEADRATDPAGEPSLADMTGKAIDVLKKNSNGFFLMVEGGRIDHAHHAGNAYRALTDTIALSNAVKTAMQKVDLKDTLIIVTADHSHVFTIAGYPKRGNPILGKVVYPNQTEPALDMLNLPFTTLGYANGPGYSGASSAQAEGAKTHPHSPSSYTGITAGRPNLTSIDTTGINFMQEAAIPLSAETHAGEDVAIYAGGPKAHLFHGTMEQNVIYHVMREALGF